MRIALNIDRFITTIRIVPDDIPYPKQNWCKCPPGALSEPSKDCICSNSNCKGYQRHIISPDKVMNCRL